MHFFLRWLREPHCIRGWYLLIHRGECPIRPRFFHETVLFIHLKALWDYDSRVLSLYELKSR